MCFNRGKLLRCLALLSYVSNKILQQTANGFEHPWREEQGWGLQGVISGDEVHEGPSQFQDTVGQK